MRHNSFIGAEPPERPGGSPWREQHIESAKLRARKKTWAEVAEEVGFAESTVQKYGGIDGFDDLVLWAEYQILNERRESWLRNEETLIFEGIEAMHEALIETMKGTPTKVHTMILRGGTSVMIDGKTIESDGDIEIEQYEAPSPYVRVHAAATYAKIIGYEETKKLLAQKHVTGSAGPKSIDGALERYGGEDAHDLGWIDASMDID